MNEDFMFITVVVFWLWFAMSIGLLSGLLYRIDKLEKYIERDSK